jgi:hypothetical protein
MKHDKLKPCPLCGGEVEIKLMGTGYEQCYTITRGHGSNACTCRLFLESDTFAPDDEDAMQTELAALTSRWNTRTEV